MLTWKKKELLPKDLAERAKKLPADQVEAQVIKILSQKPKPPPQVGSPFPQLLSPYSLQQVTQEQLREMERLALGYR
jgi:hypothetical protein